MWHGTEYLSDTAYSEQNAWQYETKLQIFIFQNTILYNVNVNCL